MRKKKVAPMKTVKAVVAGQATITVAPLTSVAEAAQLMAAHRIGAVPVVEGERLVGIFSERDVMTRVVATNRDPAATRVGDVMSTDLVVADISEGHDSCLNRMQQARVRHLLVLDQSRLAGIVSFRDLLAVDLDEKNEEITLLNAYIHYIPANLHVAGKT
jgi:CBS domain-containing protein